MYYLRSRYYDQNVGRFINSDDVFLLGANGSIIGYNLFGYCNNNLPNTKDTTGYFVLTITAGVTISFGTAVALIALTVFMFSYLFDKNFRNGVNQLIVNLVQRTIDGIGYISNVIAETISKAKKGKKYSGNEVHHIVAQTDYRAGSSRALLSKYGISIGSSYNLVTIKKTLHKHLLTNAYHAAVYVILKSCESKVGSWTSKKYRIISGLVLMGVMLKSASRVF